jgi:hypothetical protein
MRKALALTTAAAAVAVGLAATPAGAADTLITLPVGLGVETLAIAAPAAVVVPGSPASATIATTVTDLRLSNSAGWTATIASTDLTLVGAATPIPAAATIPATTITAYTGDVNSTVPGLATITGEYLAASPLTLSNTAANFVVASARTNVNTAIYTATLNIPTAGKTAGVYTGTVTQSVS